MHVLLVEDDVRLSRVMRRILEEEAHIVETALDGTSGVDLALTGSFDVVILDVMLPGIDGFEVCRRMRDGHANAPVLMLTARDAVEDRVRGLDSGADDYLAKPFAFAELLARLRALGRRRNTLNSDVLQVEDLTLNPAMRVVKRAGRVIELTAKEFVLLEYLMRHPGQVLTRTQILDHVWGYAFASDTNVVDIYIHYLRKKVDKGFGKRLIATVRGVGYRIGQPA
ncbi:MAG TPA: response regulator transcription factor [Dehalococcoidia bacterium]|nr:response regulator transcription factor [Dehalococcoidia bacterium]